MTLQGPDHLPTRLMAALFLPCLVLAVLLLIVFETDPQKLPKEDAWIALPFSVSAGFALWSAVNGQHILRDGLPFGAPASALWLGYGAATMIGAAAASLFGAGTILLVLGGVAGLITGVLLHFGALLLWPLWGRLRLRRLCGTKVPLVADRTIRDVIEPRIEAAAREFVDSRPRSFEQADHYGLRRDRPPTAGAIETAGRPSGYAMWHFIGTMLGPVCQDNGRYYMVDAVGQASDPGELPGIVRAAAQVDAQVDAASFFARTAVVLPADAPLASERARTEPGWRRSRRPPSREVLTIAGAGPLMRLRLDLSWSDARAERTLAEQVLRIQDRARRQEAIRAMGEGRLVAAAGIKPVHEDPFGELYIVGPDENPIGFVKVRDASPAAAGVHREHWLSVPPHMTTAREAVAWTFGMSESAYAPAVES